MNLYGWSSSAYGESVETFLYITDQTSWGWGARELARWGGALMMWQVGKRMPKKYGIEGDLRVALYDTANDFVDNGLAGRRFAGGDAAPNLADLAAFGVLRATRQTGAFRDLMAHSRLGPWFAAMEEAVGPSARLAA
ncbi:Prostaglandin E synthase 2 [Tetrabaena socialis]|uniref:Prostaglandin E synthase 2 n=1 Tax=Tetrabaena socialis TaxID=47790 RepID=A0A2J7ZPP2_9CHLO|nr:Prostaglandin E synthase 2 [Tetrabaena socialis]|eukprot:PNH02244.1 Prostaglandin E synthase 2 [Tetrabaena socialis]